MARGAGRVTLTYVPLLRYEYEVLGQPFHGELLSLATEVHRTRAAAEQIRTPYPVGCVTTVAYNPDDPSDSVLRSGGRGALTVAFVGLAFIAIDLLPLGDLMATEDGREELRNSWEWVRAGFPDSVD